MSSAISRKKIERRAFLRLAVAQTGALALLGVFAPGCAAPAAAPAPTAAQPAQAPKPAAPTAAPAAPAAAATQAPKPAAPAAAPAPTTAPAVSAKQEIVIAQGVDPQTLDPHGLDQQQARNITQVVNEALLDWDYSKNGFVGSLASEWKLLNPTTWQFKLRSGVKFANGEPFDAAVVKYNMERILDPETKTGYGNYVADIAGAEVVDALTVNIVTKTPAPILPLNLTRIGMVPPQYAKDKGLAGMAMVPVGTGPYRVVEYVRDERAVVELNPQYWGQKPTLTRVTFRPIPEPSSRVAALKTGRADVITNIPIADVPSIKSDPNLDITAKPGLRAIYIVMNQVKYDTPLMDRRVRQALNYAVDKDLLIKEILSGFGAKLNGTVVPPTYFGHNDKLEPYPYDPAKAKQLLAEAGVPNGFEIQFFTPQGRYVADKELAEAIGGQLAKVGVKTSVAVKDWSILSREIGEKTLGPLALMGMSTIPEAVMQLSYYLTGVRNSYWSYPEFDKTQLEARATFDDAKRADLARKAQAILREEAPFIFLHQQFTLYGYNKKVRNLTPAPDEWIDITKISMQ